MEEEVDRTSLPEGSLSRASWGAIFAGMFAALAVWATFGALGLAIFSSNASPNNANPNTAATLTGIPVGEGLWMVILSMVALYVGGRVTAALAEVGSKASAVMHGFVMFGLSVFAATLAAAMASGSIARMAGTASSLFAPGTIAGAGYVLFITLLLGGCTAMWGAANGLPRVEQRPEGVRTPEIRRVA